MLMKTFLDAVWNILTEIGRTRAAAAAAREGRYALARDLIK
jgi:hypothetical protein